MLKRVHKLQKEVGELKNTMTQPAKDVEAGGSGTLASNLAVALTLHAVYVQ